MAGSQAVAVKAADVKLSPEDDLRRVTALLAHATAESSRARAREVEMRGKVSEAHRVLLRSQARSSVEVALHDLREATRLHEQLQQEETRAAIARSQAEQDMNVLQRRYSKLLGEARTLNASDMA